MPNRDGAMNLSSRIFLTNNNRLNGSSNSPSSGGGSGSSGSGRPVGGESFTITCFTCGMPSSKEWAERVESYPTPGSPHYPFLQSAAPPQGAHLYEDGSTFLCAFCFASISYQWNQFEKLSPHLHPKDRHYDLQHFICSVCSVETYRKRVRALPFQEFPFLAKDRAIGSLTLGNNPLAVVCLDCSETLWSQSAEYDRWGLPIQKRHFNWMQRPPPPENSMEATVARLPSGETQLPRCPPTEPEVIPRRKDSNIPLSDFNINLPISSPGHSHRTKTLSVSSNSSTGNSKSPSQGNGQRKISGTESSRHGHIPMTTSTSSSSVPVVTVAPMSIPQSTVAISQSQDTLSAPFVSGFQKHSNDNNNCNRQSLNFFGRGSTVSGLVYPESSQTGANTNINNNSSTGGQYVSINYPTFPWSTTPRGSIDPYAFHNPGADLSQAWSWLPPTTDILRYQAYLSTLASRSLAPMDHYFSAQQFLRNPAGSTSTPSAPTDYQASHPQDTETYASRASFCPDRRQESSPQTRGGSPELSKEMESSGSGQSSPIKTHCSVQNEMRKNSVTKLSNQPSKGTGTGRFYVNPKKGLTKNNALAHLAEKASSRARQKLGRQSVTEASLKRNIVPEIGTDTSNLNSQQFRRASEPTVFFDPLGKGIRRGSLMTSTLAEESTLSKSTDAIMDLSTSNPELPRKRKSFMIAYLCSENISPKLTGDSSQKLEISETNNDRKLGVGETQDRSEVVEINPAKASEVENEYEENQFVAKALVEYRQNKLEKEKIEAEEFNRKRKFLGSLDLITPDEKSEIELETLVKRAEAKSLPPLKLLPVEATLPSKEEEQSVNDEFDKKLFRICFRDKVRSELNKRPDPKMLQFIKNLNLKPSTKFERYRREQEWRIILSERIHRERRGPEFCGKKRPWNWEDPDDSKKDSLTSNLGRLTFGDGGNGTFGSIKRRHSVPPVNPPSELLRSLSVTLPPTKIDSSYPDPQSTDLLRTVPETNGINLKRRTGATVISYPKYVPSYANPMTDVSENISPALSEKAVSPPPKPQLYPNVLNVPVLQKSDENGSTPKIRGNPICIPRVPVIQKQNQGAGLAVFNDSISLRKLPLEPHSKPLISNDARNKNGQWQWPGVDGIIQNSASQWKETKEDIEYLLQSGNMAKNGNNEKLRKRIASDMRKLRRALNSQQLEMKALVKSLKET